VTLDATITNDAGVLGRICTLIGEQDANISDLKFIDRKPDYFRLLIDIDLRDQEHFHRVFTILEADSNVSSLSRHRDPGLASAV
jgi:GTP pyrophosphokinase